MENKVGPGMFVEYSYKLYNDADDKLLFETPKDEPDSMVFGVSQGVVPGLIAAIDGLKAGDKFGVTLPSSVAFGDPSEDNVLELDREIFTRDGKLAEEVIVGADLPMMTSEGYRINGKVLEIGPEKIKMDFNHPFAGLTVRYDGEVVSVREATAEEIQSAQGCSGCCGGCGGGCGESEDGCNCGSDCDCGSDHKCNPNCNC